MPKGTRKPSGKQNGRPSVNEKFATDRGREAVLADFRRIVGPLRGRNRGRSTKA